MFHQLPVLSNPLVDSLSDFARDELQLTLVPRGMVLMEAGQKPQHVYFPIDCVVSLLHTLVNGSAAEVAVVGQEGMVGVEVFLSGERSARRAVVHCGGQVYRLRADLFRAEANSNHELQRGVLRYTQALMTQFALTAACNRHHSVDQQLCRWLLLSLDRSGSRHLVMTQEMIANMLGVRREGVTEAACKLQKRGVIAYSRGRIEILDREQLESSSCECYGVIRAASQGLHSSASEYPGYRNVPHRAPHELRVIGNH